ncbi:hypothetical protein L292_1760 [Acinetobacter junii CIP 107470 = MTCC 11364]|uniref:Uncharacterized protein n=1 Tax=Acinetobacter junii CIP 107470 = MTCC 11364 TaxID=1217666 RepID=S7WB33_ACIJU|nr:hypothetical protein [Acinetobacter junii]ENV52060.1 hypothetical protein F953_00472 [Acinetobacter junii CIP 107470 = MTCC 11364]EPR80175.1 hypothetical protein L292_1760 [Acinetobacter junii CIP 107470 = MTCC 11364]
MLEAVQGKAFVVEDLTDSLANFKSALRANSIPYVNVVSVYNKSNLAFAFGIADLRLQIKSLKEIPVVFIQELSFSGLDVLNQVDVKKIKPNIHEDEILQVEFLFKADGLFVGVKYQSELLFQALTTKKQ